MRRVRRITTSPPRNNLRPAAAATTASRTMELWDWEQRWDAAVDCMRSVRRTLDQAKYREFLDALSRVHSIGARGVVDRVKVLFRGHPDLKRQFNMFVPAEYMLNLSDDDDQQ